MSERDRAMALATLTEAFGVKLAKEGGTLSEARIRIYTKALEKVPVSILQPVTDRVIETRKPRWGDLPTVAELLEDAEIVRREHVTALRFQPCVSCEPHGWTEREIDGVKRMTRCGCWHRHQERIQELGGPVAKLLNSGQRAEPEPPAVDDVVPAISDRVRDLASSRRMR